MAVKIIFDTDELEKSLITFSKLDKELLTREIAFSMSAVVSDRIQDKGLNSDGQKIGDYSTRPTVINNEDFRKTTIPNPIPDNKKSSVEFMPIPQPSKNGKKGFYGIPFEGGYKQFRSSLGLNSSFVDVTLTGEMMNNFAPVPVNPESWGIGFTNPEMAKRSDYVEEKYGTIFELTEDEEETVGKIVDDKLTQLIKNNNR